MRPSGCNPELDRPDVGSSCQRRAAAQAKQRIDDTMMTRLPDPRQPSLYHTACLGCVCYDYWIFQRP